MAKKKIGIFTATGCRSCENIILDIHYQVNSLSRFFDIVFWPYILGSQWKDFDKVASMDLCFYAGAVSTESDHEAALRLREKTDTLIAIGACASFGGMPGLVNLRTKTNPESFVEEKAELPESPPPLPGVEHLVSALSQVVTVDYDIPGCPPTQSLVWTAIQAFSGWKGSSSNFSYVVSRLSESVSKAIVAGVLPPKKSTFAGEKAVCASCSRIKEEKKFSEAKRPYQSYESNGRCLLEQGLICQGIATREGCGGMCTAVGLPCRGCFGKPPAVFDPGAKMVSAISSTFNSEKAAEIKEIVEKFTDLPGTFYRYNLPSQCELLRALRGNL